VTSLDVLESSKVKLDFVCPRTGAPLHWDDAGITCPSTGERWERIGDIPVFSKPEGYWGEIPAEEMEPLLAEAESLGWDRALRKRLLGEDDEGTGVEDWRHGGETEEGAAPRGEFLYRYATDPTRADWRFLVSLDETSKVLDIGAGWGALAMAIAPEVGVMVASDDMIERARFLEIRARQSGLDNVMACAAPAQEIPFPDGTFDLIILNGVLEWVGVSRVRKSPRDVQRHVLENVHRKLAPGGSLYVAIENRWGYHYFLGTPDDHTKIRGTNLMPRWLANTVTKRKTGRDYRAWTHGMDGYRRLLRESGFASSRFWAPVPTYRNPREFLPLDDPTVFEWYTERFGADTAKRRLKLAVAKRLFRAGLLPRMMPHFGILARKGASR
jgi:SAM-dependent methyltransferase